MYVIMWQKSWSSPVGIVVDALLLGCVCEPKFDMVSVFSKKGSTDFRNVKDIWWCIDEFSWRVAEQLLHNKLLIKNDDFYDAFYAFSVYANKCLVRCATPQRHLPNLVVHGWRRFLRQIAGTGKLDFFKKKIEFCLYIILEILNFFSTREG